MHLVHTTTMKLEHFNNGDNPRYAILSHTWGKEEVTFREMQDLADSTLTKSGYKKIIGACEQARKWSLDWVWVDTCCIDKSSSAELSEAINSMYGWYQSSDVCFAYLEDVTALTFDQCRHSRWWSRGWTLQELIAPRHLRFYTANWVWLEERSSCAKYITMWTGIPQAVLNGGDPRNYSIAQRMHWASSRQTTRTEDMAYCLLGLLDVYIPLLYGEGKRAFARLQEEVIRLSADQSIFAWSFDTNDIDPVSTVAGVLADSPTAFASCSDVPVMLAENAPFTMTNLGLNIQVLLQETKHPRGKHYTAILRSHRGIEDDRQQKLFLRHLYANQYVRVAQAGTAPASNFIETTINIVHHNLSATIQEPGFAYGIVFKANNDLCASFPYVHIFCGDTPREPRQLSHHQGDAKYVLAPFLRPVPTGEIPWTSIVFSTSDSESTSDGYPPSIGERSMKKSLSLILDFGVSARDNETTPLVAIFIQDQLYQTGAALSFPSTDLSATCRSWNLRSRSRISS
jgi:hypothetical protein